MPTIGINRHSLIHGLSDFWLRFYADITELEALYTATELQLAQKYLDMLSSFLNISLVETPLFNLEYFKLITIREDEITFQEAQNAGDDRYVYTASDNIVEAAVLQNKVIDPTSSVEEDEAYNLDATNHQFEFYADPSGAALKTIGTTQTASLLTYGLGILTRCYVSDTSKPFLAAKAGDWVVITTSGSGNNGLFRIGTVLSESEALLQGTFTLPEANNGILGITVLSYDFFSLEGFAQRTVTVEVGGSFDDPTARAATTSDSWYFDSVYGLNIKKGDIIRVLDKAAVAVVPQDFKISVVRHHKLYISADTPIQEALTSVASYVILRKPYNTEITEDSLSFTQTNQDKSGSLGSTSLDGTEGPIFTIDALTPAPDKFAASDKFRYLTVTSGGAISFTASLSGNGTLTRTGGGAGNPFARARVGSKVTISGSITGQNGTYTISEIADDSLSASLVGTLFEPETGLSVVLDGITNVGTYKVKKVIGDDTLVLTSGIVYDDPNNGSLSWQLHDGYQLSLAHTHIVPGTTSIAASLGSTYTGGYRSVINGTDYTVDSVTGAITQIGYFAGTWGVSTTFSAFYEWLKEVYVGTTGVFDPTDIEADINRVALWAPDVRVDKYHLYNNYGYLINRFQDSSETYREFIRGVFQLYILGPTLERLESALNTVSGFPVARDDGEVLSEYDSTSSTEENYIRTIRGTTLVEYAFDKAVTIRDDIVNWVSGDPTITFQSFEPFTELFQVTDYVDDPTWWEEIVIPRQLMPSESLQRRTTVASLYDSILGAADDPRVGDPGFYIGADDEGVIPPYIATTPAKRRKMANVAMDTFLKFHIFFVRFDASLYSIFDADFIEDLKDLILIAKPGYKYIYIEPFSEFVDTVVMTEDTLNLQPVFTLSDMAYMGEGSLTLQSFTWGIGDHWRDTTVTGAALTVTDDITPPGYNTLAADLIAVQVKESGSYSGLIEWEDYWVDYEAGRLYPLNAWPAGTYTADYRRLIRTPAASADPSIGDTPFTIGGTDPALTHPRMFLLNSGVVTNSAGLAYFSDTNAYFSSTLHTGTYLNIRNGAAKGIWKIRRVLSQTSVLLDDSSVPAATNLLWSFTTEEPQDGILSSTNKLVSASSIFLPFLVGRRIRILNSGAGNDGVYLITSVDSMTTVTLEHTSSFTPETNVHWRLEGPTGVFMDVSERPVQITVTTI